MTNFSFVRETGAMVIGYSWPVKVDTEIQLSVDLSRIALADLRLLLSDTVGIAYRNLDLASHDAVALLQPYVGKAGSIFQCRDVEAIPRSYFNKAPTISVVWADVIQRNGWTGTKPAMLDPDAELSEEQYAAWKHDWCDFPDILDKELLVAKWLGRWNSFSIEVQKALAMELVFKTVKKGKAPKVSILDISCRSLFSVVRALNS